MLMPRTEKARKRSVVDIKTDPLGFPFAASAAREQDGIFREDEDPIVSLLVGCETEHDGRKVRREIIRKPEVPDVFNERLGWARIDLAPDHPVVAFQIIGDLLDGEDSASPRRVARFDRDVQDEGVPLDRGNASNLSQRPLEETNGVAPFYSLGRIQHRAIAAQTQVQSQGTSPFRAKDG